MADPIFFDRRDAGRQLGALIAAQHPELAGAPDAIVLGLARGGVPVAAAVAGRLDLPLDAFWVRKVGAPGQPELAAGAVASGGIVVRNEAVVAAVGLGEDGFAVAVDDARRALLARERAVRGGLPPPDLAERTVILVDDGLATGASARAAVRAVRGAGARRVVLAVPVAASDRLASAAADIAVCVAAPHQFTAVGLHYRDFTQVTDDDVRACLRP